MIRRFFRQELLARNLTSFVGLALVAVTLFSLLANYGLGLFRREQYEESMREKLMVALEDMERQFTQAEKVALDISISSEFNRRIFSQHKYYEVELVNSLTKYADRLSVDGDYFVIYFADTQRIYHMDSRTQKCGSTFTQSYLAGLGVSAADELLSRVRAVEELTALDLEPVGGGERVLLVCPFHSVGNRAEAAAVCWVWEKSAVAGRVMLAAGGIGESFALWRGEVRLTESARLTENGSDKFVEAEKGDCRLAVDVSADPLFDMTFGVDRVSGSLLMIILLVLLALSIALALFNYHPIWKIKNKYRRGDGAESDGIEGLIDEAYAQLRTIDGEYTKRLREQRFYLPLLILNGVCSERVRSSLCILPDELRGPWYAVMVAQVSEGDAEAAARVEDLSDETVSVYACSFQRERCHILLSMREEDAAQGIRGILEDMLEETGLNWTIGLSDAVTELSLVNGAMRQAEARLNQPGAPAPLPEAADSQRVAGILAYLDEHAFDENLSLTGVAAEFGFNATYMSRMLKLAAGVNFHSYVTALRVAEARRLLRETELPISEVSVRVGYNSLSHFIKLFRESTGLTPGNFRKAE